jgi:hypothetical protein
MGVWMVVLAVAVLLRLSESYNYFSAQRANSPNALMYISTAALREYTNVTNGRSGTEAGLKQYIEDACPDATMYIQWQ